MKYNDLIPSMDELMEIRNELYHSAGKGYYVIRGFLDSSFSDHIIKFWNDELPLSKLTHERIDKMDKSKMFYSGCPNYVYTNPYGVTYFNWLWNEPYDEVTYAAAWKISELRNLVMSKNFFLRFFPGKEGRTVGFRVIQTTSGENIVPSHKDWIGETFFDPSALQATLILSEHGKDYTGDGMLFTTNQGEQVVLNKDLDLKPGDLVLWRYINEHAVQNIQTTSEQMGFLRIIFPPENLYETPVEKMLEHIPRKNLLNELKRRVKQKLS